jgi:hypothetical protein
LGLYVGFAAAVRAQKRALNADQLAIDMSTRPIIAGSSMSLGWRQAGAERSDSGLSIVVMPRLAR